MISIIDDKNIIFRSFDVIFHFLYSSFDKNVFFFLLGEIRERIE